MAVPTAVPASIPFDPALADVVIVHRVGEQWVLEVRRFTGDRLASTVLHIHGDARPRHVVTLARHLLERWGLVPDQLPGWDDRTGTWSSTLRIPHPLIRA
ncbi:hypothetical protein [Herbiconiux sp. YIM B11900]|uniref:hypothetical protein n=1 Tax=Herbiconiux sp. YIM B11900 TaxID=3404131 RepID=UPI003F82A3C5